MHFFQSSLQSFASVALLLPALLVSAYPHSHERRIGLVDELKLFEYPGAGPSAQATPFVTLVLGEKRTTALGEGNLSSYDVEWKKPGTTTEIPAIAVEIKESEYDEIKRVFSTVGTWLGSGQDAQRKVWIIVSRSEEPDQDKDEAQEDSVPSDDEDDDSDFNY